MIAGPNGSGKTTLLHYLRTKFEFPLGYCLKPDEIDQEAKTGRLYLGWQSRILDHEELQTFIRKHPLGRHLAKASFNIKNNSITFGGGYRSGYLPLILCDFLRSQWLSANESFTFETVMSHPSKIELFQKAIAAGYRTYLYYICTESNLINTARIANRVAGGGHKVSDEKVNQRRQRGL